MLSYRVNCSLDGGKEVGGEEVGGSTTAGAAAASSGASARVDAYGGIANGMDWRPRKWFTTGWTARERFWVDSKYRD